MIVFNNPEYAKQRQEVKPLSLEEMEEAVDFINDSVSLFYNKIPEKRLDYLTGLVQDLIWQFENLLHASVSEPCQCCYKNTTADIDVNYELVSRK